MKHYKNICFVGREPAIRRSTNQLVRAC